jgi:drug/metabolite transporter (DMT)-like permease
MTTAASASLAQAQPSAGPGFRHSPALALTLAALFWSGNFIAGRALRGQVDPLTLNFARWLIALLLLVPFAVPQAAAGWRVLRREWRLILALGATGIAVFHALVYQALQTTTATNALLMLSLAPLATLLGVGLVGTERPSARQFAGGFISLAGAATLITQGDLAGTLSRGFNAGDLWMIAAVIVWAAYSLILRRRPADLPPLLALVASIVAALAMLAPFVVLAPTPVAALAASPVALSLAYIALFSSAVAFLLWSHGVARLGPARAGHFVHLMPVFGAALAFVLLDEALTAAQVGGAVLVLSGIAVVERRVQERAPQASPHFVTWV